MKITGKLTMWVINPYHNNIEGYCEKDYGNSNRQEDTFTGKHIYTSSINHFSENGKYAHTINSIYELDPPHTEA